MVLAEANIGRMKYALEDPRMDGFRNALDEINALAERSAGFVWRLQTEYGNATDIRVLEDPLILFNMSVWRTPEDLFLYTYRSDHGDFFRRRAEWFRPHDREPVVMWWIEGDAMPVVQEAVARLERLWTEGRSPEAFTLRAPYDPDGTPYPADWRRGLGVEAEG